MCKAAAVQKLLMWDAPKVKVCSREVIESLVELSSYGMVRKSDAYGQ